MRRSFRWMMQVLLLVVCISCSKSTTTDTPVTTTDTTVPTISVIDPVPGFTYILGKPLHLQMNLGDNSELKTYRIRITKNLKGVQTSDWAFDQSWTLPVSSKSLSVNHNEITIPLTVAGNQTTVGNYDFTAYCTDKSGNESSVTFTIALAK